MDIEARTRRSLEWDRLKLFLAQEARTKGGKEKCLAAEAHVDRAVIQALLDETEEALALIESRSDLSLDGLPDLGDTLSRLATRAVLSAPELYDVKRALAFTRQVKNSLSLLPQDSFPRLIVYHKDLTFIDALYRAIDAAVDEALGVKDEASTHLRNLRREVQRIDGQIKDELTRIIHSSTLSKALQEPIYTQRNGRWVLPVNANMRKTIDGIVHDSSASGLTVYVEPLSVVELANKMRIKETDIEREINRILTELTDLAAAHHEAIDKSYATLIELDTIMARAHFAVKYRGYKPELTEDHTFLFNAARHPLLVLQNAKATVVPNDIGLEGGDKGIERTLVITGPNTGGKTVLLKTVGILSLMVRAGLLLPVKQGSKAAIFTSILADIGDEQSLEQSLSTFSSHMSNIVEVVNSARPGMLALLDEVGAGTDPKEGAAIARAVLEHLNSSGAVTISTTHFGELKTLAYTQAGFVNASLDFDETTLSPTYRLRIGVPGSSKATTISQRIGLAPHVVQQAVQYMKSSEQDLQRTVEELEKKLKELSLKEDEAEATLERAKQAEQKYRNLLDELDAQDKRMRIEFAQEMESEFKTARDLVRQLIADLQKQPNMAKAQKAQEDLDKLKQELGWFNETKAKSAKQISQGQPVLVKSLNQRGMVEDIPSGTVGPDTLVVVRAGNVKIEVPVSDLDPIGGGTQPVSQRKESQKPTAARHKGHTAAIARQSKAGARPGVFVRTQANTIDLRGLRVEPAMADLDRFLNECIVSGVSPMMIIHGHGTGAVKAAVREFLDSSSYAISYRAGDMHEGGDGVTIVDID